MGDGTALVGASGGTSSIHCWMYSKNKDSTLSSGSYIYSNIISTSGNTTVIKKSSIKVGETGKQ